MRRNFLGIFVVSAGVAFGALLTPIGVTVAQAAPAVATNPTTGDVTVTLNDNTVVVVPAALASQVIAAMSGGDPSTVTNTLKSIVLGYAANNPNLAAALYVLATSATSDPALQAAAYAGVVAGNPAAATQVAANSPAGGGAPGGGGTPGGGTVAGNFPTGGTSGGGSTPSVDIP